jgi:tRNA 2-thiocytidine biosynthesis protein TtcA
MELPIAKPPWTALGRRLESMCRKAIFEFDLFGQDNKVAVALSGGKDSLTLLYLLKAISGRGVPDLELHAVHVGGKFSCGASISENYLRSICEALEVNFILKHSNQTEGPLECYSCSRERRKLLFDAAKEVGARTVAFGHHRDDSIETLMMNLLHKAEFAAMLPKVPMEQYGVTVVRPLIYLSESETREFAKLYGFSRIVCQCPVGQKSMRRQVKQMIAEIEETFPNVRENLSQSSFKYGSTKALYPKLEVNP